MGQPIVRNIEKDSSIFFVGVKTQNPEISHFSILVQNRDYARLGIRELMRGGEGPHFNYEFEKNGCKPNLSYRVSLE